MRAHRTVPTITAVVLLAFLVLLGTGTHSVARGETLAGIASRHGTTVAALAAANGIDDPNHVEAGRRLVIPSASGTSGTAAAASSATRSYTVRRGDTLGSIASSAGSTISAVIKLNRLTNPNLIRVGQVLKLPGGSAPAAGGAPVQPPAGSKVPAGGATTHVVRAGDTIGSVARRYEISQAQLIAANGLTDGRIYVGQRLLLVPRSSAAPAPAAGSTRTHTVRAGETLSDIARRYGTTIRAIQQANRLADADHLLVGQTLTIPAGSAGGGGLVCPVRGTMRHMNDWGFPRSAGRFHEGNDLFAARGTPAVAMIGGTAVQRVGLLGGNQVKLLGNDGVAYYYTHLDRFGAGGRVKAGEVIGYVGSTGNAAGGPPHIHFEVHPASGPAVNPFPIVAAAC